MIIIKRSYNYLMCIFKWSYICPMIITKWFYNDHYMMHLTIILPVGIPPLQNNTLKSVAFSFYIFQLKNDRKFFLRNFVNFHPVTLQNNLTHFGSGSLLNILWKDKSCLESFLFCFFMGRQRDKRYRHNLMENGHHL